MTVTEWTLLRNSYSLCRRILSKPLARQTRHRHTNPLPDLRSNKQLHCLSTYCELDHDRLGHIVVRVPATTVRDLRQSAVVCEPHFNADYGVLRHACQAMAQGIPCLQLHISP